MNKIFQRSAIILAAAAAISSCTDEVKFGDAFIEKAPGGTVTLDTVFTNATYTQQFLNALYSRQYYGLPYSTDVGMHSSNPYTGKFDGLTDLYQQHWAGNQLWSSYYTASLTANESGLMGFTDERVWEVVRQCYLLIEHLPEVPGLTDKQRAQMKAEAQCMIASRYFDLFPHYGGLPIITKTYTGVGDSYDEFVRSDLETTVKFMTDLLDEAAPNLPWAWNGNTQDSNSTQLGRWTKAGALALKAKILTFAASPLFNNEKGYFTGDTPAETDHLVWYGNYDPARWQAAADACKAFFDENTANGNYYHLWEAEVNSKMNIGELSDQYRQAYRKGYIMDASPENIHWTKVCDLYGSQGSYCWWSWGTAHGSVRRLCYYPTFEYMCMFDWSDGTPFDWDEAMSKNQIEGNNGRLFYRFTTGRNAVKGGSRDPRLYENIMVNGQNKQLDWTAGVSKDDIWEFWVGGNDGAFDIFANDTTIVEALTSIAATGFAPIKYLLGEEYHRKRDMHWNVLTIPDMLLTYAECLAQTGRLTEALTYVDQVRARVGMKKLASSYTALNLASNKENLIEQILRERACELGMTNSRYFDMVRYRRLDWMTQELHGLATFRMVQDAEGNWIRKYSPYIGDDKKSGMKEPQRFEYCIFTLQNRRRALWELNTHKQNTTHWYTTAPKSQGMSWEEAGPELRKWLLTPFPQTEINKGYGLVQNPGW